MLITILAHIIVALGVAALAALIATMVISTVKCLVDLIGKKLKDKFGGKIIVGQVRKLCEEAAKEAEKRGNIKSFEELTKMAEEDGVFIATSDSRGNIDEKDIKIYHYGENRQETLKIQNFLNQNMGQEEVMVIGC